MEIGAHNHPFHGDLRAVRLRGRARWAGSDGSMWWSASSSTRISLEFTEFLRLRALSGPRYRSVEWSATKCDERLGTRSVSGFRRQPFSAFRRKAFSMFQRNSRGAPSKRGIDWLTLRSTSISPRERCHQGSQFSARWGSRC